MSPRCSNVLRVPGPRSRIEEDVVPHTWLSDRWSHLQVVHTLHGIKALPAASSYLGRRMPQEIRQSKGFGRRPRQVKRSNSVLLWSQRHTLTSSQSSSTVFLDHCTKRHLVFIHCGLASSDTQVASDYLNKSIAIFLRDYVLYGQHPRFDVSSP